MNRLRLVTLVLALCAAAIPALAIEVPLTYMRYSDMADSDSFRPWGGSPLDPAKTPPTGECKLPAFNASTPLYVIEPLGDEQRLFVFDKISNSDACHNRMYFDSNGDGNLNDETAIDGVVQPQDQVTFVIFPAVDTSIRVGECKLPFSFRVTAYLVSGEDVPYFNLTVDCAYQGTFALKEKNYTIWLSDSDGDARFDGMASFADGQAPTTGGIPTVYPQGDRAYITDAAMTTTGDRIVLSNKLVLGEELFDLAINIPDKRLTLTPVTAPLAKLTLPVQAERVSLYTSDKQHVINMYRPALEVPIPTGDYRLLDYRVSRQDDKGANWAVEALGTPDCSIVTVGNSGEPASMVFGEPYVPTVNAQLKPMEPSAMGVPGDPQYAPPQPSLSADLQLAVRGAGNEVLVDLAKLSGDKSSIPLSPKAFHRPKEPVYKIVSPDGELVTQGQFEYG